MSIHSCYIFDLEGTLSDNSHRIHLAKEGKWDEYGELISQDMPRVEIVTIYRSLQALGFHCAISTGLSAQHLGKTVAWLKHHAGIVPDQLMMRPIGNRMPSDELKLGHLNTLRKSYSIKAAFDDRDKNAAMYTREGVQCLVPAMRHNY